MQGRRVGLVCPRSVDGSNINPGGEAGGEGKVGIKAGRRRIQGYYIFSDYFQKESAFYPMKILSQDL